MPHCYVCKTTDASRFYKDRTRRDRLCSRCKDCNPLESASHRERAENDNPKCHMCRQRLRPHDFYRDRTRYNGLSSKCKQCHAKKARMNRIKSAWGGVR